MLNILNRRRAAALMGVAIIAGGVSLGYAYQTDRAVAAPALVENAAMQSGSFAALVDADKPAVVTITTTMKASADNSEQQVSPQQLPPEFRRFFEQQGIPFPGQGQGGGAPSQAQKMQALGSGFIISPDGYIVTNNHVIDNATDIKVTLDDGTTLPGKLVGADAKADLAVVKIDAGHRLPTIAWGDSDRLKLGDQILAIGNPFGIGTTVTAGIVSARGRDLHSGPYDDFIQIDAPINHGNSGGPLVDRDGNVVGINTAIYSPNGGSVGVGFAIPSNEARQIVAKLQRDGSIAHGYLGVAIQPVTPEIADAIGLAKPEGALVANVEDDTPAAKAGVKTGDIVIKVGDEKVGNARELSRLVADLQPGDHKDLTVFRAGKDMTLNVTIGGEKTAKADGGAAESATPAGPKIGVALADLTPEARSELGLSKDVHGAVVAQVAPDKPAADAGLKAGDVIVSVNDIKVGSAKEARNAVAEAAKSGKKSVLLLVQRGENRTFVAVPFSAA